MSCHSFVIRYRRYILTSKSLPRDRPQLWRSTSEVKIWPKNTPKGPASTLEVGLRGQNLTQKYSHGTGLGGQVWPRRPTSKVKFHKGSFRYLHVTTIINYPIASLIVLKRCGSPFGINQIKKLGVEMLPVWEFQRNWVMNDLWTLFIEDCKRS